MELPELAWRELQLEIDPCQQQVARAALASSRHSAFQLRRSPVPVDLYHATDFVLPPTRSGTRTLLTVHDLSFVRVPAAASPPLKAYLDAVVPPSVEAADHILADSEATKADLIELYRTPADKITVLYSGVNPRFRRVDEADALQRMRHKYGLANIAISFPSAPCSRARITAGW